jgi:hypothetical protein
MRQMALGAGSVCVQKVGETEAMVYGGVGDVLMTDDIVGRHELWRLMALAPLAQIGACVAMAPPQEVFISEAVSQREANRNRINGLTTSRVQMTEISLPPCLISDQRPPVVSRTPTSRRPCHCDEPAGRGNLIPNWYSVDQIASLRSQ